MKRLLVAFILLTLLTIAALPALAGGPRAQIQAHGWTQMFPATNPPPRSDTAMAYDTARGRAVLFGGYSGDARNDTWEWDSATLTWVERLPAHQPPVRYGHAMAYDAARGVTVLFGGVDDVYVEKNDTWLWDGEDWVQAFPADAPCYRWVHRMVYDSARQVVVLVGGLETAAPSCDVQQVQATDMGAMAPDYAYGDTWEWDGASWSLMAGIGPLARYNFALAYDSRRNVTVLFGGDDGIGGTFFNETLERPGAGSWEFRYPPVNPEARQGTNAVYMPRLRRTVVYGGFNYANQRLSDTLIWNGSQWQQANLSVHPTGSSSAMVYDSVVRAALLYSGLSANNQYVGEVWYFR